MSEADDIAAFRYGYGLPLPEGAPRGAVELLSALAGQDIGQALFPAPATPDLLALHETAVKARADVRKGTATRKEFRKHLKRVEREAEAFSRRTFARALASPDGFRERLAWFWADHFTTVARLREHVVLTGDLAERAVRPHLAGRFTDMLLAADLHPAMLLYLDQSSSIGPGSAFGQRKGRGLNENLAREAIELHTLGVGAGYAQDDVRQLAELLTGLGFKPGSGLVFYPRRAEPGAEEVLGQSYDGEGMAPIRRVLEDMAHRPETARHLSRKLATHFLTDTPDPDLIERMAAAYLAHDTALLPVYEVMLSDPSAFAAPRQKARQPVEFIIGSLRALEVTPEQVMTMPAKRFADLLIAPMRLMGQEWGRPIGPDGWAEEAAVWITPQGLGARIAWAMDTPDRLGRAEGADPRGFVLRALGSLAPEMLRIAVARSESTRDGLGLVLASPEFNRR